jgi:uncharacterized membrane protein YccC
VTPVRWPARLGRRALEELRRGGRQAAVRVVRLTGAAVVAFVACVALLPQPQPLTGPLTALIVTQVTLHSTVTAGLRRVLSVVSGVVLAVLFSSVFDLTWWSLGVIVAAALTAGLLLRLGEHLIEAAISAMLVLGVASAETAATARVAETLIGAAVGMLANLLFPPGLRSQSAGEAVERVAVREAELLERVAEELPEGATVEQAQGWLDEARSLEQEVDRAEAALIEAREARRLNPRAVGTADADPVLATGLDALEHATVALRALFRSIADRVRDAGSSETAYDEDLRGAFAVLLTDIAATVRAFGALVRAEATAGDTSVQARLAEALEALREARARVAELLTVDPRHDAALWELNGSLLAAVARVLRELDVEERERQRERWQRTATSRAARAAVRLRQRGRG